jgi:integrase
MGRKAATGGVFPKGDRIQIRFEYRGKEYRPSLDLKPTAANLKHAARMRLLIVEEIKAGVFDFVKYFPDYRFIDKQAFAPAAQLINLFDTVADKFIKWVKTRQEHSSVLSLERKIGSFWRPVFGTRDIRSITYPELSAHVADRVWGSNKTHNNYVSALREMMAYALDHEYLATNPADKLKMLKVQRPEPDPYNVTEARALLGVATKAHGAIDALYWELSFLLGMRPGEQISIQWLDWNRITGRLTVQRMRTENESKDSTKTHVARHMDLSPRAVEVLTELRPLTQMRGPFMFIDYETGGQINRSTVMQERWVLLHKLAGVRYREPYQCRHSSVSWQLMAGENLMKVAKNHGHSLATMLKTYAHWIDTDSETDEIKRIRAFHGWVASGSAAERSKE